MNQELMTLDFWQDTVIYEGKILPVGTLACDALLSLIHISSINVPSSSSVPLDR